MWGQVPVFPGVGEVCSRPQPPPRGFTARLAPADDAALGMTRWMFDQAALQEYILLCCQCPAGGLLDKPGK